MKTTLPLLAILLQSALTAARADAAVPLNLRDILTCRAHLGTRSTGEPHQGKLRRGLRLPAHAALYIRPRNRKRANWGTQALIATLLTAAQHVQTRHPHTHPLVVGDLSARRGGALGGHLSHQNGLDADISYILRYKPPKGFTRQTRKSVDFTRTWTLIDALLATGWVSHIFTDQSFKSDLRRAARRAGHDPKWIAHVFSRIIQHAPHHRSHLHIRVLPRTDVCKPKAAPLIAEQRRPPPARASDTRERLMAAMRRLTRIQRALSKI